MRWIDFGAAAAAALTGTLAGCGTVHEQGAPDRNASPATAASTAIVTAAASAPAPAPTQQADAGADGGEQADAGADAEAESPAKARTGPLAHFYADLDGLVAGTRKDHVRILWLGDSHGQADFWSGKLRTLLQKRFGSGGPGFIHIGFKGYRHDGVDLSMKDQWGTTPRGPATGKRTHDGVFGLGGLLTSTTSSGAEAAVEIRSGDAAKKLSWDLCYRFVKPGQSIQVSVTGLKPTTLTAGAKIPAVPPLLHTRFTTSPFKAGQSTSKDSKDAAPAPKGPRLTVAPASGVPYFCGVVVEADPVESPGVVLDAAGINGARYTTALAWDEEAWLTELSRRSPSLVILEYGTNEAGDVGITVDTYSEKVARVVARIRKKKAETDCAILAPTERANQEERSARIRDILRDAAKENGCFFWDTIEAMGGKGSMRSWRADNPPKGAKDGIHLTVRGYQALGEKLAEDLLERF